uniref:Uncharacterized protein n=1 Tax=Triticum urartu TaxID=4572 RepID=A0A8R7TN63_TRIUA
MSLLPVGWSIACSVVYLFLYNLLCPSYLTTYCRIHTLCQ